MKRAGAPRPLLCWFAGRFVFFLEGGGVVFWVACLTSQQHASVSQGRICSDKFTCCHTEIKDADQTFYITQSQYTGTGSTGRRASEKIPTAQAGIEPGPSALDADALTTRSARRSGGGGGGGGVWVCTGYLYESLIKEIDVYVTINHFQYCIEPIFT